MKKLFLVIAALAIAIFANAQAPQYGRFHKSLFGSAAPSATCTDGTLYWSSSLNKLYVCDTTAWVDPLASATLTAPVTISGTATYGIDMNGSTLTNDLRFANGATFRQFVSGTTTYVGNYAPSARPSTDYAYLFGINDNGGSGSGLMTGGAAQKTYGLYVTLNRPLASAASGDSNDSAVKVTINNYALNDANFIQRAGNFVSNNRTTGTLGKLSGVLSSASCKSGTTCPYVWGAEIGVENFGTNATEHGALDLTVKNEGAKATTEFGVRVRNLNNSIAGTSGAAFLVSEPALVNTGWDYILDANGVEVGTADIRLTGGSTISGASGHVTITPTSTNNVVLGRTTALITDASATPSLTRAIRGEVTLSAGSVAIGSNSVVGTRGAVTLASITTGFVYGAQGKVIATGTIDNGSGYVTGSFGQLDVTGATITSGHVAALTGNIFGWNAGTSTVLTNLYLEAAGGGIINSHINTFGKATYWADIDTNVHSPEANTTCTSSAAGATGAIKVRVDGVERWIPLVETCP